MKTADQIAKEISPHIMRNNAAIGETNRRLVKIGNGEGLVKPENPLVPREVYYRSSLDQNDRGIAILDPTAPISIDAIDGYYDVEVWLANIPGTSQPCIVNIADTGGQATDGATPDDGLVRDAAFTPQERMRLMLLSPSLSGGLSIFVDVGDNAIAYNDGVNFGFIASQDIDLSDPTNDTIYNPTTTALASGKHRILGIGFDPNNNRFVCVPGTASDASGTLPQRSDFAAADYLAINFANHYRAGYLYNYYGQTDFEEDDCLRIYDPRLIINHIPTERVRATTSASAAGANTTTETTLLGTINGSSTFAANSLSFAGRTIRITAMGYISDTGTPTITVKFRLGSTVILSSGAVTLGSGISNKLWKFEGLVTVQTAGSSGQVIAQGQFTQNGTVTDIVNTSQTGLDLTTDLTADLTAQWSAASASNTVTCTNFVMEVLN